MVFRKAARRPTLTSRPRLSVCCIANSPGAFLQKAILPLRDLADEIVIAAGGPVPEDDLEQYAAVADRLFTLEFAFVERHLSWLHGQCEGDWILRLDGDEVPSPELLAEVAAARDDRRVNSVAFARRHLFPTVEHYITQEPWYPDFQVRMIRNDGTVRFLGQQHTAAERTLPTRYSEAPLYHLPFLMSSREERQARAARYEAQRPGLFAPTGLPANDALVPEQLGAIVTKPTPAPDLEMLTKALGTDRGSAAKLEPISVSLAESDRLWAGRQFDSGAYRARLDLVGELVPFATSEVRPLYVAVTNEGDETWGWDPSVGPYVHLVLRLTNEEGDPLGDWQPAFFTEWVGPGTTTIVPAQLQVPAMPGRYRLELDVRHAPHRLFATGTSVEIDVRPGGAWGGQP